MAKYLSRITNRPITSQFQPHARGRNRAHAQTQTFKKSSHQRAIFHDTSYPAARYSLSRAPRQVHRCDFRSALARARLREITDLLSRCILCARASPMPPASVYKCRNSRERFGAVGWARRGRRSRCVAEVQCQSRESPRARGHIQFSAWRACSVWLLLSFIRQSRGPCDSLVWLSDVPPLQRQQPEPGWFVGSASSLNKRGGWLSPPPHVFFSPTVNGLLMDGWVRCRGVQEIRCGFEVEGLAWRLGWLVNLFRWAMLVFKIWGSWWLGWIMVFIRFVWIIVAYNYG